MSPRNTGDFAENSYPHHMGIASHDSWIDPTARLETAGAVKRVFGVPIHDLNDSDALAMVSLHFEMSKPLKLGFCNAHTANLAWQDAEFRALLQSFTMLPDGLGVDIAAKTLHGSAFAANLNGTDFIPMLLQRHALPLTIALLGAKPGVAEQCAVKLTQIAPQHKVVRILDGYAGAEAEARFLAALKEQPVDLLLVALGNPRQERWIQDHVTGEHATVAAGVGALFDFMAGIVPRAPEWVRRIRMEWAFRLMQEPTRLFRRYVFGNPTFLWRLAQIKLGLKRL